MTDTTTLDRPQCIDDCRDQLVTLADVSAPERAEAIIALIREHKVVLLKGVEQSAVDSLMLTVTQRLKLESSLQLQSAFASVLGTRRNVGDYYMTVNDRSDYNIVPPHSEGSTFTNLQLASFYCVENTTDGGETLLFRSGQDPALWSDVREYRVKCRYSGTPTDSEKAKARTMYRLNLDEDVLSDQDTIVNEATIDSRLQLFEVLSPPTPVRSVLTGQPRYVFWDSICALDFGALRFMRELLMDKGLFKTPPSSDKLADIDWDPHRRQTDFNVDYSAFFDGHMMLKLAPGDFLVMDNTYWSHAVNNWTPGSGTRTVSAAFA